MSSGSECVGRSSDATTVVRRFSGNGVEEIVIFCRANDAACPAAAAYNALRTALDREGVPRSSVMCETVYSNEAFADREVVRVARDRAFAGLATHPATTCIQQPPLCGGRALAITASAVVPRDGQRSQVQEVVRGNGCACEMCSRGVSARMIHFRGQRRLYAGNVYGSGADAFEEAYDMFRVAAGLLADAGMAFGDVIRVWIYLRDIDRDYDTLNRARREFFRECGLEQRPASTGVQGVPFPAAHDFSMSLYAMKSEAPTITAMSAPSLNEAWTYGADFSRGLRVEQEGEVMLYLSGTASIDESGKTVHVGDFEAQVDRMLHNIELLLAGQGATFGDVVSGVGYLKNPDDAEKLRARLATRGLGGLPYVLVEARLCRPELLCEMEVAAALPGPTSRQALD